MVGLTREEGFKTFDIFDGHNGAHLGQKWFSEYVTENKHRSLDEIMEMMFGDFYKLTDEEKESFKCLQGAPITCIFDYYSMMDDLMGNSWRQHDIKENL